MRLAGPGRSLVEVDPSYDIGSNEPAGPFVSLENQDGRYVSMRRETNRRRIGTAAGRVDPEVGNIAFFDQRRIELGHGTAGGGNAVELKDFVDILIAPKNHAAAIGTESKIREDLAAVE